RLVAGRLDLQTDEVDDRGVDDERGDEDADGQAPAGTGRHGPPFYRPGRWSYRKARPPVLPSEHTAPRLDRALPREGRVERAQPGGADRVPGVALGGVAAAGAGEAGAQRLVGEQPVERGAEGRLVLEVEAAAAPLDVGAQRRS